VLDSGRWKMDAQIVRLALERSRAMTGAAHAVIRLGAARVASNRTSLRERAERTSARNRRWIIREKLWDGRLPSDRPAIVYGGPGNGARCAGCEKLTSASQLVMAIPLVNGESSVYLHADCFQVWETLRRMTITDPLPGPVVALPSTERETRIKRPMRSAWCHWAPGRHWEIRVSRATRPGWSAW